MSGRRSAAVITISDGVFAGERPDGSGDLAEGLLREAGYDLGERRLVPDERAEITAALRELVAAGVALVVTTGGTGFGPRDVTPEATRDVITRDAPGLATLMLVEGLKNTPYAALSRAVAGSAERTLIVNLPGSTKAVQEGLAALLPVVPHALDLLTGSPTHH